MSDINSLLKGINIKKATGPDTIPPKLVRMSANIIDSHLCNLINMDIDNDDFSDGGKIASVRPLFKKNLEIKLKITDQSHLLIIFFQFLYQLIVKHIALTTF